VCETGVVKCLKVLPRTRGEPEEDHGNLNSW